LAKGETRHPGDALARAIRTEEELERFFELSIDMLGVASFDGYFTRVNPAFERVLGYSVEEVRRESFVSFVHPGDREATVAELERISRGAQTVAFENRYRTSSGGYRWLQWTGISDPDHRVVYAVARDVTDAKQVEAETRALLAGQAALRRVATRVAREGDHTELFELVTEEVGRLLEARSASIVRYEPDGHGLVLGGWGEPGAVRLPSGSVVELESESAAGGVYRTGQALRVERFLGEEGTLASKLREMGFQSAIGAPIYVDGKLWGALIASRDRDRAWPAEAERSLADFGELVAQAIANADARDQLAASRVRAVGASDAERRRLERNLHDGAQQRLVALSLTLRLAQTRIDSDPGEARRLIEGASQELTLALAELRELANGLHPALLADRALAQRSRHWRGVRRFPSRSRPYRTSGCPSRSR